MRQGVNRPPPRRAGIGPAQACRASTQARAEKALCRPGLGV